MNRTMTDQEIIAVGREKRLRIVAMRAALDTRRPRTAAEIEAANAFEEYRHGCICFTNEVDGREIITGISPSFTTVFA